MGPVNVVENTLETLVITLRHRVLPIACFGCGIGFVVAPVLVYLGSPSPRTYADIFMLLAFMVGSLVWFFGAKLTSGRNEFRFEAASKQIFWRHEGFFSPEADSFPFVDIARVEVQKIYSSSTDGGTATYRLFLGTRHRNQTGVALACGSTWGRKSYERAASSIRAWLQSHGVAIRES